MKYYRFMPLKGIEKGLEPLPAAKARDLVRSTSRPLGEWPLFAATA
jgi:hypothetical protein